MADFLRLLFELDANGEPSVKEFKRVSAAFATEIAVMKKLAASAVRLNVIESRKSFTASPKDAGAGKASAVTSATGLDKASIAAQKLERQQQALVVQTQELANRQERARQTSERLAQSQQRLAQSAQRLTQSQKITTPFSKKLEQDARSAESLQRQRSAGIIRQLREQEKAAERTAKAFRDRFLTLGGIFENLGQTISSFGSRLSIAVTAPLAALAAISVKGAIGLDAQVNTLKAFTGSAEAAEQRLAKLIATAQQTPGLTTSLSLMLDSQLRLANVTVETIDKVTPALGRLNAVQKLQDPGRFSQNLVQLVTQNFERIDLKELVGQSPVAGQIIKEMFNVDSPINAEAIRESAKRMGLTTTDAFFTAFAEAAARNPALASVTESIATRFDKLADRVTIALRPLGVAIIDAVVPFVNLLVPILESLGRGFANLPGPVKTLAVALGAVVASAGPVVFLLGSMISTVGSLIGAYARLVALGLTPTIKGFQLLVQVMRGTAALTAGQAATTAAAAAGWAALGGVVVIAVAAIAGAYLLFSGSQKEAVKVSAAQLEVMDRQINGLKQQARFLDTLQVGVQRTTQEQKRLRDIYDELNLKAKARVEGITDEERRLATLREELGKVIKLKEQERVQQAANLAGSLGATLQQIDANEKEIRSITARVQANAVLSETIEKTGKVTTEQRQQLARLGINASDAAEAVAGLQAESENLVATQISLREATDKLNGTAEEQAATLLILQKQTGLSARELLTAAKAMGVFRGDVESALSVLERFTAGQTDAASATRSLTDALTEQTAALLEAGKQANELQKQRKATIEAAADLAREASDSLAGADKFLRAFIAAQPELRAAIEKERQLQDKTLDEFITDTIGGRPKTRGEDQETQRRIRLIEIEADKVRTITDAQLAREQIAFDERNKSLEDYTHAQIDAAHTVLTAQLAVFQKERLEAAKIRKQSERDLSLAQIGQKEFEAQQAFTTKATQLEAARRKEEETAAIEHRQKLLDIQDEADRREISRLEELSRSGSITAFELERRRAEIDAEARKRRRAELETQLKEAKENKEERQRIQDELDHFNEQSAAATEEGERRKREALQETADAYRDYVIAIREASEAAAEATRNAAAVALERLNARVFLTEQQRIERQFSLDKRALEAEKRASDLRIDNAEREAVEKSKKAGKLEQEALTIEKAFHELRLAEQKRFDQERRRLEADKNADLQRADPNSTRSLFGDTFADFGEVIRAAADQAGVAISNLQVILGGFGAAAAEHFANASAAAGNFISILLDGISQINAGLGDMLSNWILTGEVGSGALRKLLASTLAYYSRTFLIKALDNVGEGFSNLAKASAAAAAGNLVSAALYKHAAVQNFLSAAKYGIASAATAVAGRFAAGDSFKQKDTASRAVNGGEDPDPRNRTFNLGGQGPVETSSEAAREGTGGMFGRLTARIEALQQQNLEIQRQQQLQIAQLAETQTRMRTARPGDVVTMGASDARQAIGVAVIDHSNSSGDFNENLTRNLGIA